MNLGIFTDDKGRSPRVRGRPSPSICVNSGDRSIPACAGEATRDGRPTGRPRVDPRVCGGGRA